MFITGLACAAIGLLAVGAALGRAHWFVRYVSLLGAVGASLLIPAYEPIPFFLLVAALVIVPLAIARTVIQRRRTVPTPNAAADRERRSVRRTFSLQDLLLMMALIGVGAAIAGRLPLPSEDDVYWSYTTLYLVPCAAGSTLVGAIIGLGWCFLGTWKAIRVRLALTVAMEVAAIVCAAKVCAFYMTGPTSRWAPIAVALHTTMVAGWLALWRWSHAVSPDESNAAVDARFGTGRPGWRQFGGIFARIGVAALTLAIVAPLGYVYYRLIQPIAIPDEPVPNPNAYDELVRLGERLRLVVPDAETATPAMLRSFVAQHESSLEQARAALDRPSRVPVDFTTPGAMGFPAVSSLLGLMRSFDVDGLAAEADGRTDDALRAYLDVVRLGRAGSHGGMETDVLIGSIIEAAGLKRLTQQRAGLSSAQCRFAIRALVDANSNREPLDVPLRRDAVWWQLLGWKYRFRYVFNVLPNAEWQDHWRREFAPWHEARYALLETELAIRAYRLDTGRIPSRLDDLAPSYLASVPRDPFGGEPLVYCRTPKGFLLYSVGPDGRDDGGQFAYLRGWNDKWDGDLFLDSFDKPQDADSSQEPAPADDQTPQGVESDGMDVGKGP